ncbi:DUF4238 domain-containing protein [Cyanothece sp. BG0011]|uniref:DUF4238 domain-containing protein n=1 Tax=Cyanothece sp. BG0011 TaxID=2082950 RepID=UPI000D1F1625|nr:DUF4238 domain-containing protein [Cyanothece sp. BG0011]
MSKKAQHIIPCVYLKNFCLNPREKRGKRKINCVNLDSDRFSVETRRIEKVAKLNRFYSIKKNEGEYDDSPENNNADIESTWNRVIDDTIKLSDKLSFLDKSKTFEKSQLSIELKGLISHLFWRVEARRTEIESFLHSESILIKKDSPERFKEITKLVHLRETGLMAARTFLSFLNKEICIFISEKPIFITSDNPVIISDGDPHGRTDILNLKSIIQCAISPKILVVIYPSRICNRLSEDELEKMLKVSNKGLFENENFKKINHQKIKVKKIDDLKFKEFYNELILIESKRWLFSNNQDLLREILYLLPQRSKERPKITNINDSSLFVSSRRRFLKECLKDLQRH